MSKAIAIIVAAGSGNRAGGGLPKQFRQLLDRPVLAHSAAAFRQHAGIGQIVIVTPPGFDAGAHSVPAMCDLCVEGGPSRAQSVQNGLNALSCSGDTPILIHDAARPGLSQSIISSLLLALETADAAAPALPLNDAVKRLDHTRLTTVDRAALRRVQTPQAFRYDAIATAMKAAAANLVDDLEAIEAAGKTVTLVAGDERLHKITFEEDFAIMERLLSNSPAKSPRMGTGYDVHRFGPGDHVTLCGVKVPHSHGLVGHSDADIAWHALTDAILGAVAMGDIGDHFPPSDPQWKDADSGQFLLHAQTLAREAGYAISNIDITLICEAPKVKPYREAMRESTARLLGLSLDAVSVKATTTETLGFTGRHEGMAGQAAAVLTPITKPV